MNEYEEIFNTLTTKLGKSCPFCNKHHTIEIPMKIYNDGLEKMEKGARIQDAFPTLTPSQREFIKTGICDDCWENL